MSIENEKGWSESEVALVMGAASDLDAARLLGITEGEAAVLRGAASDPIPKKEKTKKP